MTTQQALREARKRWGTTGAVKRQPNGGYIGEHGEFVDSFDVRPKDSKYARAGHYCCQRCTTTGERVYHKPGRQVDSSVVGLVQLGMFFEIRGEGFTWTEAFAEADEKIAKERARLEAMRSATL